MMMGLATLISGESMENEPRKIPGSSQEIADRLKVTVVVVSAR